MRPPSPLVIGAVADEVLVFVVANDRQHEIIMDLGAAELVLARLALAVSQARAWQPATVPEWLRRD